MNQKFKEYLLHKTKSSDCEEVEVIQSLWSDYGKISRYALEGSHLETVVVKHIALKQSTNHPRGWNTNISHDRKVKSYEVETHWYENWNSRLVDVCKTADFIGSFLVGDDRWIILEDLNKEYPSRKTSLNFSEVKTCIQWLARFHGTFISESPDGLWQVGTYWHLSTRPDEYAKMKHELLKSKANDINQLLNQSKFQTIVHGDAKLANFCFSDKGDEVAAVDFQYVGGGCGMKDLTYFMGSCMSGEEIELYDDELLKYYFKELKGATINLDIDFDELEAEWRALYPVATTDFIRFLLGWMPTHHKINDYNMRMMEQVLAIL
ncbi:MAG: oxidoreductase family protein [Bacteroidia bacterium]